MFKRMNKKHKRRTRRKDAQVTIEFTFCVVVVMLILYGMVMILRWAGIGIAERRMAHEFIMRQGVQEGWLAIGNGPLAQLDPNFYRMRRMRTVFGE